MRNFIVQFSTCDCLISKFVSKFCVGGLGSLRVVQYSQIDSIGVSGDKKGLHWYQWYDWYQWKSTLFQWFYW